MRILLSLLLLLPTTWATAPVTQTNGESYALVIGITGYPHFDPAKRLRFADKDAQLFYDFITDPEGGQFAPANIVLLKNERATRSAIFEAIRWLENRVSLNDRVYVFFSGHGMTDRVGSAYLMPYDADPAVPEDRGIPVGRFVAEVNGRIGSKYVVTFLDACYAGAAYDTDASMKGSPNITAQLLAVWDRVLRDMQTLSDALNLALMSAGSNQVSYEDANLGSGHGIFTWFLVEGMRGRADEVAPGNDDGIVTAGELYRYVLDRVEAHSSKFFKKYSPAKSPEFTDSFPLSVTERALLARAEDAKQNNSLGLQAFRDEDYQLAATYFRAALQLDPDFASAHVNLGVSLERLGRHDEAIAEYRIALRLDPNSSMAHNNMGFEVERKGDLAGAERHYRRAIELDANNGFGHYNLAEIYEGRGDLNAAAASYSEAIRSRPDWESPLARLRSLVERNTQLWHYLTFALHEYVFEFDEAYGVVKDASARDPGNTGIKLELAEVAFTSGRYFEASTRLRELIAGGGLEPRYEVVAKALDIATTIALGVRANLARKKADLARAIRQMPADTSMVWTFDGTRHVVRNDARFALDLPWLDGLLDALQASDRQAALRRLQGGATPDR